MEIDLAEWKETYLRNRIICGAWGRTGQCGDVSKAYCPHIWGESLGETQSRTLEIGWTVALYYLMNFVSHLGDCHNRIASCMGLFLLSFWKYFWYIDSFTQILIGWSMLEYFLAPYVCCYIFFFQIFSIFFLHDSLLLQFCIASLTQTAYLHLDFTLRHLHNYLLLHFSIIAILHRSLIF